MLYHPSTLAGVLICASAATALVRPGGVGRLPAMGWNSWNAYGCNVDAEKILSAAEEINNLGLKDVGYEYVNIDDCWSVKTGRDQTTGRIIPDPEKFPEGIDGLATKIHDMGLKIGIYSAAGTATCAGYPASLGYEQIDAETFAEWGIDYLKYDNCNVPGNWTDEYNFCVPNDLDEGFYNGTCPNLANPAPPGYNWAESNTAKRYYRMRDALESVNRTILFSLCEWGTAGVQSWGNTAGNSWRMSDDINPSWERISEILNMNSFNMNYEDFWGRPDPDMLEVNNGQLTLAENRAHFALWAAMKSPLLIGTDLSNIKSEYVSILANKYLTSFATDPKVARAAHLYKWGFVPDWTFDPVHPAEYWSGPSSALGGTLVLMLNTEFSNATRTAVWSETPELNESTGIPRGKGPGKAREQSRRVVDVWTGKDLGCIHREYAVELERHDVAALLVKERC